MLRNFLVFCGKNVEILTVDFSRSKGYNPKHRKRRRTHRQKGDRYGPPHDEHQPAPQRYGRPPYRSLLLRRYQVLLLGLLLVCLFYPIPIPAKKREYRVVMRNGQYCRLLVCQWGFAFRRGSIFSYSKLPKTGNSISQRRKNHDCYSFRSRHLRGVRVR